jgi:NAD(P)-dependent dehydrogenase (short-subunit alcohol dehydrogenase family)
MMSGMSAFVTGAGGALGGAIAERLAADGLSIAVVDVDPEAASATVDRIAARGGAAVDLQCDLRESTELERVFSTAAERLGPVSVLVNNAAVFPSSAFVDVPVEMLDETTAINQRAYFLAAQLAARSMIDQGGGVIVNVASIVWHGRWIDMSPYVAAKGAVVAMTRALARELGPENIRVNAVAPGAFPSAAEAAQHPDLEAYEREILDNQAIKRRGRFEDVASLVSFLVGEESSFITGQTINVDGGWIMS